MLTDSNIFYQSFKEKKYNEFVIKIDINYDIMTISIKKNNSIYESDLNYHYFKKNQLFLAYNTISEIAQFIYKCIDENRIIIEDNKLNLKLIIISNISNITNLEIFLQSKNSNLTIDQLIYEIETLKKENRNIILSQKEINNKLEEVKKENEQFKKINEKNENKIKELENKINNIEQKKVTQITNCNLKLINSIQPHNKVINSVSIFPSGNIISVSEDKSIKIYNSILKIIQEIKDAHKDMINYVEIKDENNFMTCSKDKSIKLWIKKSNSFINNCIIPNAHEEQIIKVIYLPNGNLISCSYDSTIKFWKEINNNNINNSSYKEILTLYHFNRLASLLYLEDKNILISSGEDGTKFWKNLNNKIDFNNIKLIKEYKETFCGWNNALCKLDDDRIIVGGNEDGIMSVISISEEQIKKKIYNNFGCWGIYLTKNKNLFFVCGKSKSFNIYRSDNYECIQSILNAHNDSICGLIETKDESILSYSNDKSIKMWCF